MKKINIFSLVVLAAILSYVGFKFYPPTPERSLSQNTGPVLYYWTQFVGDDQISFRTILKDSPCPEVVIDGQVVPMSDRADIDVADKVHICEARANQNTQSARIEKENIDFALVKNNLSKVVAFGDTGCRKKGMVSQNCGDPDKWPFEKISVLAANLKPDLAIHLGDYNYRDKCPKDNPKCANLGTDVMDLWESWEPDVVRPMTSLFKVAPFIFVRGNHEDCGRFGKTWFKLFGGELENETKDLCLASHKTIDVKIDNHRFVNIDSASEQNQQNELNALTKKTPDEYMWVLTHRPFLAPGTDVKERSAPKLSPSLLAPGALQLVMAGHTHIGSFISFKDNKPPELLLGNGGVLIDLFAGGPDESHPNSVVHNSRGNGFAAFNRIDSNNWMLQMYSSKSSSARITCRLNQFFDQKTQLDCND